MSILKTLIHQESKKDVPMGTSFFRASKTIAICYYSGFLAFGLGFRYQSAFVLPLLFTQERNVGNCSSIRILSLAGSKRVVLKSSNRTPAK